MRKFLEMILHKRHLVIFLTLLLFVAGIFAYQHLLFEGYPDVANMQVVVITHAPGKAAEEIEKFITIPIEKELNGVPHANQPYSMSIFGLSVITIVFDDAIEPNQARQQILERLQHLDLPEGIKPQLGPNASALGEVFRYTVEGKHFSPMARKEIQDWILNRKFKSVPGIIDVTTFGGPTKTYQVQLDPVRMNSYGITQDQVTKALSKSNDSTGGSYVVRNEQSYMVRGIGLLRSIEDIEESVIEVKHGLPISIKDIATVKIAPAIRKGQFGKNEDDDAIEGIVIMRRGENPSVAVDNIRAKWASILRALPEGIHIEPLYNRITLVKTTVNTISNNVAEGIFLVVALLMLFLFQVRISLICAVVIPLALLTAFILLNLFQVPANLLSIGAIDFGIIVDGAVLMVENISRRISKLNKVKNYSPNEFFETVIVGANEIAKPALFATAIILLTFLPILSFEHVEGRLFRPLAVMMNFTLIGGVLATMTIIPVLCFVIFQRKLPVERESPIFVFIQRLYERALNWSMHHKRTIILLSVCYFLVGLATMPLLGSEFLPELEEGNIWLRVTVLPISVSPEKSVKIAHEIRKILRSFPEVTNVASQIASTEDGTDPNVWNNIEVLIDLKPQEQWRSQFKNKKGNLIHQMDLALRDRLPSLLYSFSQYIKDNMDEAIASVKGGEFVTSIYGPDLNELTTLAAQTEDIVQSVRGMVDVSTDKLIGQPQLKVIIDRKAAARYGITADDILEVVETSIGGNTVTQLLEGDRRFDVILRFKQDFREDPDQLKNILIPTPSGQKIPVIQVAQVIEDHGANQILRNKNERRVTIKANIRGRDLGSAVMEAQQKIIAQVKPPLGYEIGFAGQFDREQEALARLAFVVPATLVLIFVLLYIQFTTVRLAALIMCTVPLAAAGGILALFISGTHFSISAGLGFIALFGVAIQNGVILIAKIRDLKKDGLPTETAVKEGCLIRMRPVMIATIVALAGLVPAAISTGIGSHSQRPFAIVIVGGILPATILTLLVLPILYQWFDRKLTLFDVEKLASIPEITET